MSYAELKRSELEYLKGSEKILSDRLAGGKEGDFDINEYSFPAPATLAGQEGFARIARRIAADNNFIHVDLSTEFGSSPLHVTEPYITTTAVFRTASQTGGLKIGQLLYSHTQIQGRKASLNDIEEVKEMLRSMEDGFSKNPPPKIGFTSVEGEFTPQKIRTFFS